MSDIMHLLIPKQFAVHCLPGRSAGGLNVTIEPPKATCASCLTIWRKKKGIDRPFKVAHTASTRPKQTYEHQVACAICGGPAYLESAAEGYTCSQCGASDSDE